MPRCSECYEVLTHRELGTHLEWCASSPDRPPSSAQGPERLARDPNDTGRRIERWIEAVEAETDRLGTQSTDRREPVETEDLTPPPT